MNQNLNLVLDILEKISYIKVYLKSSIFIYSFVHKNVQNYAYNNYFRF